LDVSYQDKWENESSNICTILIGVKRKYTIEINIESKNPYTANSNIVNDEHH
jgi:hypothetical protein